MTGSSNLKPCRKRMKVKPIPEKTALPPGSMIGEMLAMQQISLSSFASALEITETDAEALLAGGLPRLVQGQTHEGLPAPARRRGRHGPAAGAYQRPVAYRITILHRCSTTCSGVSHTVTSLSISSRLMKPPLAMLVRSHSSRPAQ